MNAFLSIMTVIQLGNTSIVKTFVQILLKYSVGMSSKCSVNRIYRIFVCYSFLIQKNIKRTVREIQTTKLMVESSEVLLGFNDCAEQLTGIFLLMPLIQIISYSLWWSNIWHSICDLFFVRLVFVRLLQGVSNFFSPYNVYV